MPKQPAQIVVWDNFSGGDYGTQGGERAPQGTFKASNMIVRANGMIGPRPGLRNITPDSMPDGFLLGIATGPVVEKNCLFIIDQTAYHFDLGNTATAPTAFGSMFPFAPNQPVKPKLQTADWLVPITYGAAPGTQDKMYVLDPAANTLAELSSDSLGGHEFVQQGQQIIVAQSEFSNQLDASSPIDPTDWSAGLFADIGDDWQVTALFVLKNVLAIIKRTGWHILSGVFGDPTTQFIRQISQADGVLHPWQAEIDQNDQIWFWPLFKFSPGVFNGAALQYLGIYDFPTRENDDTLADEPIKRSVVVIDGDKTASDPVFIQGGDSQMMLVQHNGVWTFHNFETTISAMAAKNGQQLVITDGGGESDPAQFYSTVFTLGRPAFTSDTVCGPGDNSDTPLNASLTLPQHWSQDGREMFPRQLVVDFVSWDTGTEETNHFDMTLRILGTADQNGVGLEQEGTTQSWDEVVDSSSADGTRRRAVFWFSETHGAGVELQITNIRGVDFRAFTLLEPQSAQEPIS